MLNEAQNLNRKVFDKDVEAVAIRVGYGDGLAEAAESDDRVVGLCADLTSSTKMDKFAKRFPSRFIEVGVAEQNLALVGSGLAHMGKIPFVSSYAMFSPGRNWEQIRTTIAYNNVPVKIAGSHAGISVGPDGGTHQAIEDVAIMRVIPRMKVVVPCDSEEARKATMALAADDQSPAYLRLARNPSAVITTKESPFKLGRANVLWESEKPQVAIIACGVLVHKALIAAKELREEGIETTVVNNHTIKPMDEETIIEEVQRAGAVVTIEDHQVAGGMGSAVAEVLAKQCPMPIEFIGVKDKFGESGSPEELIEHFDMGVGHIKEAVKGVISRKR